MTIELPDLPYSYDSLERWIDERTMRLHHIEHHGSDVRSAVAALAERPHLQKYTPEQVLNRLGPGHHFKGPPRLRRAIHNSLGGHLNHAQFWSILSPNGGEGPTGSLAAAIDAAFTSFDVFRQRFADAATSLFGNGWTWLVADADGTLDIMTTVNEDSPYLLKRTPLLGLDLWEHAYYLRYENDRLAYVRGFWNVVNWHEVEHRWTRRQALVAGSPDT